MVVYKVLAAVNKKASFAILAAVMVPNLSIVYRIDWWFDDLKYS